MYETYLDGLMPLYESKCCILTNKLGRTEILLNDRGQELNLCYLWWWWML